MGRTLRAKLVAFSQHRRSKSHFPVGTSSHLAYRAYAPSIPSSIFCTLKTMFISMPLISIALLCASHTPSSISAAAEVTVAAMRSVASGLWLAEMSMAPPDAESSDANYANRC